MEALSLDDDLADQVVSRAADESGPRRRMTEWSPDVEVLSLLHDRVCELIQVTVATAGGKPRQVPPAPRPVTALQRARERRRLQKHRDIVARVLPNKT